MKSTCAGRHLGMQPAQVLLLIRVKYVTNVCGAYICISKAKLTQNLLILIDRLAGHLNSELLHEPPVDLREHYGTVSLAAAKLRKCCHHFFGRRIRSS